MTNSIQPSQSELETWQSVFVNATQWTDQELGYHITLERLDIQPDLLPLEEQQATELYEFTLYQYAKQDWQENQDRCRRITAKILQREQERKKLWSQVKNHQDVIENWQHEKETRPANSTTRAMDAFYGKYYNRVIEAGVEPDTVSELAAREDKFLVNTERAIARTIKGDLTQQEKDDKIVEIMDDAITLPYASDIKKRHLNGKVKIPRDILWLKDGTRLVTFICDDDEMFLALDKHTGSITAELGNIEQVLIATKDERIRQDVLTQLKVTLAVVQAGNDLSLGDRDIIKILTEYGYVIERNGDEIQT